MKTIIIIHWFNYWKTSNKKEYSYLIKKLEEQGYKTILFEYEDRPNDLDKILEKLNRLMVSTKSKDISLVGFSLGSYISIKYLEKYNSNNIKNIILCCPLVLGSRFFKTIYKIWPNWKYHSGKVLFNAVYDPLDYKKIPKNIDLVVIRGKKRINRRLISLLAQVFLLGKTNDGLFELKESDFGNKKITLPIGHYESHYSPIVANTIINILSKK